KGCEQFLSKRPVRSDGKARVEVECVRDIGLIKLEPISAVLHEFGKVVDQQFTKFRMSRTDQGHIAPRQTHPSADGSLAPAHHREIRSPASHNRKLVELLLEQRSGGVSYLDIGKDQRMHAQSLDFGKSRSKLLSSSQTRIRI